MSQLTSWDVFNELVVLRDAIEQKKMTGGWKQPGSIQEIRSGAIIPSSDLGIYQIQANTAKGLLNFCAVKQSDADPQSDIEQLVLAQRKAWIRRRKLLNWRTVTVRRREPADLPNDGTGPSSSVENLPWGDRIDTEETPRSVLEKLRRDGQSPEQMRTAVLAAEVLPFSMDEAPKLCELLRTFVSAHRDSNVTADLVAVGAAIRKLVAYLPAEHLGSLAALLEPGRSNPVPLDVELEITKTIVRKLVTNPPAVDDSEPVLSDRLWELDETYLNQRQIAREKYGATALNASLGLMLLRSPHVGKITSLLERAKSDWFTQLLCRRVHQVRADLQRRVSTCTFSSVTRFLTQFLNTHTHS